MQERFDDCVNDEVCNFFINSINLRNGFTTNKVPQDPPLYAVNIFGIIHLFKYGECSSYKIYYLNISNVDLKKNEELHEQWFDGIFKS